MELLEFADKTIDTGELLGSVNRVTNELTVVDDRVAIVESFSHSWAVSTDEGLVVFDASGRNTGNAVVEALRTWRTDPVHTIVYTHGHMDHVGGAAAFLEDAERRGHQRPRIIGHANVAPRLARYRATNGYNVAINVRQFAPSKKMGIANGTPLFVPEGTPDPDVSYDDTMTIEVGGERFVLRHGKGETDDHTWTQWEGYNALFVGDFLIWNFPNCGNPQKVLRYPVEWAANLRLMDATSPNLVAPAHGLPVRSPDRASRVLGTVAEALEGLVRDVIELLNADATLNDALHTVRVPPHLLNLPWLRPFYDEPEFVVHNIWRTFGGWWDGNPAHLLPAPEQRLAVEIAGLTGGVGRLSQRALALSASEDDVDQRSACELIELAYKAAPTNAEVNVARMEIYARRRGFALSLMAKGIYEAAVRQSADAVGVDAPDMARLRPLS